MSWNRRDWGQTSRSVPYISIDPFDWKTYEKINDSISFGKKLKLTTPASGVESDEFAIDVRGGTLDRSAGVVSDDCAKSVREMGDV